jgi:hypothetical protein
MDHVGRMPRMVNIAPSRDVTGTDESARPLSPPALRMKTNRLRDPRLWLGVVLVACSALVGGRVLAAADDTITLWRVAHDIPRGTPVESGDLEPAAVHFADGADAGAYLRAGESVPRGARAAHALAAGELLAASALDPARVAGPELPLGVEASDLPADLSPGEQVAVWAVPAQASRGQRVTLVLEGATLLAISSRGSTDVGSSRDVLLAVDSIDAVGAALRLLADSRPVLVRTGS